MEIQDIPGQVKQAQTAYQKGDYQQAADLFQAAALAYQAQGQPAMAAEMANNQSVALLQAGEAQAALDAATGTDVVFEGEGDRLKKAMAIGNQAAALDALGRLEEAEEHYQHCAELLFKLGEEQMRAQVMQALSSLQLRSGRQLEALASMQAGLDTLERPTMRQRFLKRLLSIPKKIFPK